MKQTLSNISAIINSNEKRRFTILILLDVVSSVLDIASLALLLWVIRFYAGTGGDSIELIPGFVTERRSLLLISLVVCFFILKNWMAYAVSRSSYKFAGSIANRLSEEQMKKYQAGGFLNFINIDSSLHLRDICYRPFDFSLYVLSGFQQLVTQACLVILAIIALLIYDARIVLLLAAVLLPPAILLFLLIRKRGMRMSRNVKQFNDLSFRYARESLQGFVESNIYNKADFFRERFLHARKSFSQSLFDSIAIQGLPSRIIEVFAVAGLFIVIAFSYRSSATGEAAFIGIGAFMAAAYKIIPGIVKIINLASQLRANQFDSGNLSQAAITSNEVELNDERIQSIEFRKVSFRHENASVVNDISFQLNPGDFLGIRGASGKGKTTLMNLMLGFLTPSSGIILINEIAKSPAEISNYWPQMAYMQQDNFFLHDSLSRNICFETDVKDHTKLGRAIRIAGLGDMIKELPGLHKEILEDAKNLSGGQRQRVALARALYKEASLILLDEPLNELDEESTMGLLHSFQQLAAEGKMIVMISHDAKSLSYCNKNISLDES